MITDANIDNLYNIAIDILENKIDKKEFKDHMNWYNEQGFSNKDTVIMICSRLIEKIS